MRRFVLLQKWTACDTLFVHPQQHILSLTFSSLSLRCRYLHRYPLCSIRSYSLQLPGYLAALRLLCLTGTFFSVSVQPFYKVLWVFRFIRQIVPPFFICTSHRVWLTVHNKEAFVFVFVTVSGLRFNICVSFSVIFALWRLIVAYMIFIVQALAVCSTFTTTPK